MLSGTEVVDFIRERTQIQPIEAKVKGIKKQAIAFTIGFEYEQPHVAMGVANEILTMMLKEDARTRTAYATETTSFIERDARRLEAQLALLNSQIAQLEAKGARSSLTDPKNLDSGKELAALKSQLLVKSVTYSDSHPDIKALKRKIEALEKTNSATNKPISTDAAKSNTSENASSVSIDALEARQANVKKEFEAASRKLATARLGESLERGQHSERLQVIEQPTLPTKPVSPNRPKLFAAVIALALMAGGGLAMAGEMLDHSVRRSSDLFSLVDSHLVVSIPYISTTAEERRKKRRIILTITIVVALILAGILAIVFLLPSVDLLFDKLTSKVLTTLFR